MPAVDLTRLRFQVEEVFSFLNAPKAFHRHLTDFFSLYANRALRFGESNQPRSMIPRYHLPDPVTRQIKFELLQFIQKDAKNALALADELWNDTHFEVRQLAIFILDLAEKEDPEPVASHINSWLTPDLDPILVTELLSTGTQNLQSEHPQAWESLMGTLLEHENPKMISYGLEGLTRGVERNSMLNLHAIFRFISPILQKPNDGYIHQLGDLILALAKRSPTETAFFLKQTLSISDSTETVRMVKQVLPLFPGAIQRELRSLFTK